MKIRSSLITIVLSFGLLGPWAMAQDPDVVCLARLMEKLNISTKTDLVRLALESGLVD